MKIRYLFATFLIGAVQLFSQATPPFEVVNAISDDAGLAPGVVAVIQGKNITPDFEVGCAFSNGIGWANDLYGVEVLVNQKTAPIAAHCRLPQSDGSIAEFITCQFPVNLGTGDAEVIIKVNNTALPPVRVTLQSYAPALSEFVGSDGRKLGSFLHRNSGDVVTAGAPATPGEVLFTFANGLGPTDPLVSEGHVAASPAPRTVTAPTLEIDGKVAELMSATLRLGYVGVYEVSFRVPDALSTGEHTVRLSMAGIASNLVRFPGANPRGPVISAIVNAASYKPGAPIAPGSIVSLFGTSIGGGASTNLFPATSFGAVSVRFNGTPAPLFAVVPESGQINALVPLELAETGQADVTITTSEGVSGLYPVQMTSASPAIFRLTDPGNPNNQFAAALLANTAWLAVSDSFAQALGVPIGCSVGAGVANYCAHPLRPGETMQLFLTGLGRTTPDGDPNAPSLETGQVAPASGSPLYRTVSVPQVTIGGLTAQVTFVGLAPGFAGLYQLNAIIPGGVTSSDATQVTVSMPGGLSDTAFIAVREQ